MSEKNTPPLESLSPDQVLDKLDLSVLAGLPEGQAEALRALRDYYREKFSPLQTPRRFRFLGTEIDADKARVQADQIVNHTFEFNSYPPVNYGDEIDWEADVVKDIEWIASLYRWQWAQPLAFAYAETGDEKYAQTFVELASDWIAKHPLEKHERIHPVYTYWKGFAWLDIQTGIRASHICLSFPAFIHADAFTPEFLSVLLASLYDHQVKTELIPMGIVHNKAIFEQRGFTDIAQTFSEFKEAKRWAELGLKRARENFLAQTTPDGVQREWSGGYHMAVLSDAIEIMNAVQDFGITVPADYTDRIQKMFDYILAMATPGLGFPMFGDTARYEVDSDDRADWYFYPTLVKGTEVTGIPKYAARARLDDAKLPTQTSYAFPHAGMYTLRNEWGRDQIYFPLHCSPKGVSGHDQPDNGTFELYAYGRWLMPDTGFYTYGRDLEARAWHRQTCVHQTLTLNEEDSKIAGEHLLWASDPSFDAVTVQNPSYPDLLHRRSVWFVDKGGDGFFAILDEALGGADGTLDLNFQFAPGQIETGEDWAKTLFEDANVLVRTVATSPCDLTTSDGWMGWAYGSRTERQAIRFRLDGNAPAAFLTLIIPFRGTAQPATVLALPENYEPGADRVEVGVSAFGQAWQVGRDLSTGEAWCKLT